MENVLSLLEEAAGMANISLTISERTGRLSAWSFHHKSLSPSLFRRGRASNLSNLKVQEYVIKYIIKNIASRKYLLGELSGSNFLLILQNVDQSWRQFPCLYITKRTKKLILLSVSSLIFGPVKQIIYESRSQLSQALTLDWSFYLALSNLPARQVYELKSKQGHQG